MFFQKSLSILYLLLFTNGATDETYFAARALLYTSYSFPTRCDGQSQFEWSQGNASILSRNATIRGVSASDSHPLLDASHPISHRIAYLIANPSPRVDTTATSSSTCATAFKLGYRIAQFHVEFGLPLQIACAACPPRIGALPKYFYLLPERDFTQEFAKLRVESRVLRPSVEYCRRGDCEQNPRVTPFAAYLIEWAAGLAANGKGLNAIQHVSRWSGEQATNEENRRLQGVPNGELYISNPKLMDSLTTSCVMEMSADEMIGSNLFVNTDAVSKMGPGPNGGRVAQPFKYEHYETLESGRNESVADPRLNLEAFVSWREWSCCSACCCPPAICGYELQTAHDCDNIFSSKTRVGYLSIRKIDPHKKVRSDSFSLALDQLLDLPPYNSEGVPIFSTLLKHTKYDMIFEEIHKKLISKFGKTFTSGVFIQSESCKNDPQKLDCTKWSECHGIQLEGETSQYLDDTSDSCTQLLFQDVLVGTSPIRVEVILNDNIRIRIDPEVHNMNTTKAVWRVNMRKPKKYDPGKHCKVQGIIMKNNEILVIGIKRFDLKVDLLLDQNRKARVTFVDKNIRTSIRKVYVSVIYWGFAIIGFFAALVCFVVLMHREKLRRVQKALKV